LELAYCFVSLTLSHSLSVHRSTMSTTAITTKGEFDAWICGSPLPAATSHSEGDDEDSEDEEEEDEPPSFAPASRRGPAVPYGRGGGPRHPTSGQYSVLAVTGSASESLQTSALLALAISPFVSAYPHVRFAHIHSEISGFEKGNIANHLEVTVCPTVILFHGTKQLKRVVSGDPTRHGTLPSAIEEQLLAAVPKKMVFSGRVGSSTTSSAAVDPRAARLARFAAAAPPPKPPAPPPAAASSAPAEMEVDAPPPAAAGAKSSRMNQHTKIFKNDPTIADSYDVKFGIKTPQQIQEEKRLKNVAERKADLERHKKEKRAAQTERERLRRQIEEDKRERKAKNGYLNSRLGVDGFSPDALMKDTDGWVNPAGRTPTKEGRPVSELVDTYISQIALHRTGGSGGECMSLLLVFISNVLGSPSERKFRGINVAGKAFGSKVKTVTGGVKLLKALGWKKVEGRDKLALEDDDYDAAELKEAKMKLERAKFAFDAEQDRAKAAAIDRAGQSWQP